MFRKLLAFYMAVMMTFGIISGNPFKADENLDEAVIEYLEREGIIGYLYNPSRYYFYTASDPWQRIAGFNDLYDVAAPFTIMFYDTEKFEFEYHNKDWRIQFWKGQYGWVFIGGEIGIYTKPKWRLIEQYNCADKEDWIPMSFELDRFKVFKQFETTYETRWWCTGFIPGSLVIFTWKDQLSMKCRLTMKDDEMLQKFTGCLREKGYEYTVDGLDVRLTF